MPKKSQTRLLNGVEWVVSQQSRWTQAMERDVMDIMIKRGIYFYRARDTAIAWPIVEAVKNHFDLTGWDHQHDFLLMSRVQSRMYRLRQQLKEESRIRSAYAQLPLDHVSLPSPPASSTSGESLGDVSLVTLPPNHLGEASLASGESLGNVSPVTPPQGEFVRGDTSPVTLPQGKFVGGDAFLVTLPHNHLVEASSGSGESLGDVSSILPPPVAFYGIQNIDEQMEKPKENLRDESHSYEGHDLGAFFSNFDIRLRRLEECQQNLLTKIESLLKHHMEAEVSRTLPFFKLCFPPLPDEVNKPAHVGCAFARACRGNMCMCRLV